MNDLSLNNFISLFIVFVSWILIFFLLSAKTKNYKSNVILAFFFLVNAQDASGLFAHYFVYPKFPGLGMLINSTVVLKMPLLFLYFLSVIYSDFKFQRKHLWHLSVFILNFIIFIPRFYAVDFDAKMDFLNNKDSEGLLEIQLSYLLVHLQILVYLIISFKEIKKYKTILLENFSNASLLNYKWLFQFLILFGLEAFVATIKNIFKFSDSEIFYSYSQLLTSLLAFGFMCWIVLKALHNPELFRGVDSKLQLVKDLVKKDISNNDKLTNINTRENEKVIELKEYMLNEEPYLDPSLSVSSLANKMKIPDKELSVLINHYLNQHFFDFINEYRIEKAKQLLVSPDKKDHTVLEILYDVGFNSKSSFNTAFKKYAKVTPTEYRKTNLKIAS